MLQRVHHIHRIGLIGLAVLVLFVTGVRADRGDEPLSTDHWAYDVIYELYAGGVWGTWAIGTRPWYRGDIAARVAELIAKPDSDLKPHQRWLLSRLESEFHHEIAGVSGAGDLGYRAGLEPGVSTRLDRHDDPLLRSRLAAFVGVGKDNWWVRLRGDIDSHGDLDPTFFGRIWKNNLTGTIDQGIFSYRSSHVELLVGRDFLRWGSGSHDVLLLNDQSPPFDMARFRYRHKYFDFSYFFTGLDHNYASPADNPADVSASVKRYLAGHRLEVRPWRSLELGFSEVVVWGGPYRQLEAYYLNPLLPFYWEQLNAKQDDNPLWSFDFSYLASRQVMLYGELLIDDFQIDFVSEPQQIGGMVGVNLTEPLGLEGSFVTGEWSRIQPTVFGQNRPYNRYLNRRVGMGSILGPDADRWYLRWRQHAASGWDVTLTGERVRKGETQITTPQNTAVPYGGKFPSGVVTTRSEVDLSLLYQPDAHLRVELSGGYRWTENVDHVTGVDRDGGYVGLSAYLTGWRSGRF